MSNIKNTIRACENMITYGTSSISSDEAEKIANITLSILTKLKDFLDEYDIGDVEYKEEYLMRDGLALEAAVETFTYILDDLEYCFEH